MIIDRNAREFEPRTRCSIGAALIGSAAIGAGASIFSSSQQSSAAQRGIDAVTGMFNTGLNTAKGALQPFIDAGQSALPTLQNLLTPGPNQTATLSQLPGFQFAQDWGQKAVQNLGTMRGIGGNVLTAGANFATGLAQQGFSGLAGLLQNFTNTGASAAGQLAGSAVGGSSTAGGNLLSGNIQQGNAQAAGGLGVGNSLSNALLYSQLFGGTKPSPGMYGTPTGVTGSNGWQNPDYVPA